MSIRLGHATIAIALTVVALLVTIMSGFFANWADLEQSLKAVNSKNLQIHYRYLNNSDVQDPLVALKQTFTSSELNDSPMNFGELNQWFLIDIRNLTDQPRTLVALLDNTLTDYYAIYQVGASGRPELKALLGDNVDSVPLDKRIMPNYQFSLGANQSQELLIHRQSDGSPYTPFLFFDTSSFSEYEGILHLIWGCFIGLVLLISAQNLVLYAGVRDKAYFYYAAYVLSMLLLLGVLHGFGYYILPTWLQLQLSKNIMALNAAACYFTLLFALHFLQVTANDGWPFRISLFASRLVAVFGAICLILPEHQTAPFFLLIQLITYFVIIALLSRKLTSRLCWTKYYLISWLPLSVGAVTGYLLFSGVLHYSFLHRHALLLSVVFEMGFIAMALADRLSEKERQRLFHATHDFKYLLANEALLEQAIAEHSENGSERLAVIAIEILNHDAVLPYLNENQQRQLIFSMAHLFSDYLSQNFTLIDIDPKQPRHKGCALLHGDLFAFLLADADAERLAAELQTLSNRDNFNPLQNIIPYRIQCIFGGAVQTGDEQNYSDLITNSKRAINQAQEKSLHSVLYNPSNITSERKIRLAQDLGNAIDNDALQLYYQPQLLIADPHYRCTEVLLRWHHTQLGWIPADEFVKIAEETGLIKRLTHWVLNKTFSQAQLLLNKGYPHFNISINISAYDLSQVNFAHNTKILLNEHKLAANLFTLEITETAKFTDERILTRNFLELTQTGFRLAIDDFGTGYSSLNYASVHPFKELKIDRGFVDKMLISPRRLTIVNATIRMAKELGLHVTAEGVEDRNTYETLHSLGCDKIQGFYIARPMPFEQYLDWQQRFSVEQSVGDSMHLLLKAADTDHSVK